MLIRRADLDRISKGEVSLAFRRWRRPTVKAGGTLRTAVGLLRIDAVDQVPESAVTDAEARAAGAPSRVSLLQALGAHADGVLYRIRLAPAGIADPRDALRADTRLSDGDLAALRTRLTRMDATSPHGPWTEAALRAIATRPGTVSTVLAADLGFERMWLKTQIRKLKALGLTESLEVGYRLSPRGAALMQVLRMIAVRTVQVTRYVTPLREGGSLPAIVEADDDGLYVLKFRGAGQGARALIAELVAGEIARALGLPVPELVFAELDAELSRTEPDPEIHGLMHDSAGLNLALDYLPGSVTFDPVIHAIDAELAARIVWFDGYVTNVDRTSRNTNLLMWHRAPWLIDHGATLYFHHAPGWADEPARARDPFALLDRHVLRARGGSLARVDEALTQALSGDRLEAIVNAVPDSWLRADAPERDVPRTRAAYLRYLRARLDAPRPFLRDAPRVG